MWTNGKAVVNDHWAPGEPNNHNKADENCVEVNNPWKPRGSWNDQTCSDKNGFVCERGMRSLIKDAPTFVLFLTLNPFNPSFILLPFAVMLSIRSVLTYLLSTSSQ